jgi:hypothetical protein
MESKKELDRRPRPGEKNTHMGKHRPHRNESCRRKERNGESKTPAPRDGKKSTSPKASPPPQKNSDPSKTTPGKTKKDGSNTSAKTIRIHTPSLLNCTPPLYQSPPQKPRISSYENPVAGKPSAST